MKTTRLFFPAIFSIFIALRATALLAGVELEGWGDLRGFRIDGQLFPVVTSIRVIGPDPRDNAYTGHWQQRDIHFASDEGKQTFDGRFGIRKSGEFFLYRTTIDSIDESSVKVHIRVTAQQDSTLQGVYFSVSVPLTDYAGASADLIGADEPTTRSSAISTTRPATDRYYLHTPAAGVTLKAAHSALEADFDEAREVLVRDVHDSHGDQVRVQVLLHLGDLKKGDVVEGSYVLKIDGDVDRETAHLAIDASRPGSRFAGLGGNFVFSLDSPDVKYNLENLPPMWARMGIPLPMWAPLESPDPDPDALAQNDRPGSDIRASLELAQKLDHMGVPLIFTDWLAPRWALANARPDEPYAEGRAVKPEKWDELCEAIASYLLYARSHFGVEPKLFSFNETDLGVTIKLTPQQYHDAMARIGACFAAHGITTKLLLGDVSNPKPVDFISIAASDPSVLKYAGAISYHSWNGATLEQMSAWHAAALKAGLPLLVAEGGTDSDAYRYPQVFSYNWYAIDEAATYVDTLANAQPLSILPWEMTSDYGLIDFHGPVPRPFKRFWCLKQLSATTGSGEVEMPITCDQPAVHAAALFDPATDSGAIHLVNAGAAREVAITGIPAAVTHLELHLTDETHNFDRGETIPVNGGTASLKLSAMSYITLTSPR
jgi:hypothetical protein